MNWNDPGWLRNLSATIQWLVIGFALCAVGLQTAKHFIDLREKRISRELSDAKDQAQQQRERVLREVVEATERRIGTMSVDAELEFSGRFNVPDGPVPITVKAVTLVAKLTNETTMGIGFKSVGETRFRKLDGGKFLIQCTCSMVPGSSIIGMSPEDLSQLESITVSCVSDADYFPESEGYALNRLAMTIRVNGQKQFAFAESDHSANLSMNVIRDSTGQLAGIMFLAIGPFETATLRVR